MKGAIDGVIFIPHSEKLFLGYDPEFMELDAKVLKKYILGSNNADRCLGPSQVKLDTQRNLDRRTNIG
jgi:hypothetical protein